MGRLIDADVLRKEVDLWGMNDYEPSDFTDAIDDVPTVEAIPKADYENRLKADMVAMLTELQLEIEEEAFDMTGLVYIPNTDNASVVLMDDLNKIIQQKINSLKEA